MKYVPKIAKGISKSQELHDIKQSTDKLVRELKHRQTSQRDALQKLDIAEAQSQKDVQDLTTRLHQHIDNLAKSESAKITSEYLKKKGIVIKDMTDLDDQINATENISRNLNDFKGDNESDLFIYIKQGQKAENDAKQTIQALSHTSTLIPRYRVNTSIKGSIEDIKSLGEFEKPVVAKLNRKINVKIDEHDVDITGVCLLPDASLILVDLQNYCLMHLDYSYKVISHLEMSTTTEIYDVCYTDSNGEVAVTLPEYKEVQFFSVETTIKETRVFHVGDTCRGIAYNDGKLFICCGDACTSMVGKVRVFSLSGTALYTIQHEPTGRAIFSVINYIAVSSCGSTLHVTDSSRGVITVDKTGSVIATCTDPGDPKGICTLENDDLIVCGYSSNNILQVSRDGRNLGVVLKEEDGIVKPHAVCYDCANLKLIVATERSNTIKLFDVHME